MKQTLTMRTAAVIIPLTILTTLLLMVLNGGNECLDLFLYTVNILAIFMVMGVSVKALAESHYSLVKFAKSCFNVYKSFILRGECPAKSRVIMMYYLKDYYYIYHTLVILFGFYIIIGQLTLLISPEFTIKPVILHIGQLGSSIIWAIINYKTKLYRNER